MRYKIRENADVWGDHFLVDGRSVGVCLKSIINEILFIKTFDFTHFRDERGKGYGPIFYKLLEERSREMGIIEIEATGINFGIEDFWKKMGFFDSGRKTFDEYSIMRKKL